MKNLIKKIDWKKVSGLVPAIIQEADTGVVLMLGYMNEESLSKTLDSGRIWFYSRSRQRLWMKGETSGNVLEFVGASMDCDRDALLIKAKINGPVCHKGIKSCFEEDNFGLIELFNLIMQRKKNMPEGSYTASLFKEGLQKICDKVEEESDEVIKAAKRETKERLIEESVDLVYHLFVLLVEKNISLKEVLDLAKLRNRKPPVN